MEDTLRDFNESNNVTRAHCLNPCFNGRYSQRRARLVFSFASPSLNPCFNGRYSQSVWISPYRIYPMVLILVLMEDTLRGSMETRAIVILYVLILVLMEDTLRETCKSTWKLQLSLNPCFNGRYSQSLVEWKCAMSFLFGS